MNNHLRLTKSLPQLNQIFNPELLRKTLEISLKCKLFDAQWLVEQGRHKSRDE